MYSFSNYRVKKKAILLLFLFYCISFSYTKNNQNQPTVTFHSSNKSIQRSFDWAKNMALHYRGNPNNTVGPWYEAALPARDAFCIRDVSHQCIAAEILGMDAENRNIFDKFVSNISRSKDWCSYWEINKDNVPAPVDYRNDTAFWYNLNANFELVFACHRLYNWTGNSNYILGEKYDYFFQKTLNEYVQSWNLEVNNLLTRSEIENKGSNYNPKDYYTRYRGLPSYNEAVKEMVIGSDLIAAIYRAYQSYAEILKIKGESDKSQIYHQKANDYLCHLNEKWWDENNKRFYSYATADGNFFSYDAIYFLWYNTLNDKLKTQKAIEQTIKLDLNVEGMSYLPYLLYQRGYANMAEKYLLKISDPTTVRREYPEVSYGVIEGIVQGLMGIEPSASANQNSIITCYNGAKNETVSVDHLPIFQTKFYIKHQGFRKSVLKNYGNKTIKWEARFNGKYSKVLINNKIINKSEQNRLKCVTTDNKTLVDIQVAGGKKILVEVR